LIYDGSIENFSQEGSLFSPNN